MRHTEFWARMEHALGPAYAYTWAEQHVLTDLRYRTVQEAIESGDPPKQVWRVVWAALELPLSER
jgi:hypothetical protein